MLGAVVVGVVRTGPTPGSASGGVTVQTIRQSSVNGQSQTQPAEYIHLIFFNIHLQDKHSHISRCLYTLKCNEANQQVYRNSSPVSTFFLTVSFSDVSFPWQKFHQNLLNLSDTFPDASHTTVFLDNFLIKSFLLSFDQHIHVHFPRCTHLKRFSAGIVPIRWFFPHIPNQMLSAHILQ